MRLIYTMELKLSTLKYRLKEQCEELYNKDKIIRSLKWRTNLTKLEFIIPKQWPCSSEQGIVTMGGIAKLTNFTLI